MYVMAVKLTYFLYHILCMYVYVHGKLCSYIIDHIL